MRSSPLLVLARSRNKRSCGVQRWGITATTTSVAATCRTLALSSSLSSLASTTAAAAAASVDHHHHPSSTTTTIRVQHALDQGCIDYTTGWAWQQYLLHRRLAARRRRQQQQQQLLDQQKEFFDDQDTILLFQHQPVYTMGRGAKEEHVTFLQHYANEASSSSSSSSLLSLRHALSRKGSASLALDQKRMAQLQSLLEQQQQNFTVNDSHVVQTILQQLLQTCQPVMAPNGAPIYRVERGGETTFHGPGQLVVYPVINLQQRPFEPDLHWFLYQLEQVLIETLRQYDIPATRDAINTGVWVGPCKIAAIGVTASRWITTHGFCLNICPELQYFDTSIILPCGVEGRGVTSMADILQKRALPVPSVAQVARVVLQCIEKVFQVPLSDMESLR